jgi:hypothetical protein
VRTPTPAAIQSGPAKLAPVRLTAKPISPTHTPMHTGVATRIPITIERANPCSA